MTRELPAGVEGFDLAAIKLEAFDAWLAQRAASPATFKPEDECDCPLATWLRELAGGLPILVGDDDASVDFEHGDLTTLGALPEWARVFVRDFDEEFGLAKHGADIQDLSVPAVTVYGFLQRIKRKLEDVNDDE